jgi:hypothetical protein
MKKIIIEEVMLYFIIIIFFVIGWSIGSFLINKLIYGG